MAFKIFFVISVICLTCLNCFGQSTYKGLSPGKSTKADVTKVLGLPVRNMSETLIEYKFAEAGGKAYAQYRDKSPLAIIERIELTCDGDGWQGKCHDAMSGLQEKFAAGNVRDRLWPDAVVGSFSPKRVIYYGGPRFVVITSIRKDSGMYEERFAFYSAPLYEGSMPKSGCTGSIFGEWETNRGRMIIQRVGDTGFKGTYSNGNGSFYGKYDDKAPIKRRAQRKEATLVTMLAVSYREPQTRQEGMFVGEWKDDYGSGAMGIPFEFSMETFRGTWTQTSGSGPSQGIWEGRCVGTRQ